MTPATITPAPGRRTDGRLAQATLPRPLDHFHLFPRLPVELRLRIWDFNLPQPRVVPIRCGAKSLSFASHSQSPPLSTSGCTSYTAVPVNLHVCHESRREALVSYRPSFGMTRNPGQIFFNKAHDVLYFGARDGYMASEAQFLTVMALCDPSDLADVRHLAINDSLFWVDSTYQSMSAANLAVEVLKQVRLRMPRLERLVFVPRDENPVYDDQVDLVPTNPHGMLEQRMARQMEAAMRAVCGLFPDWIPPRWCIMALGTAQPETQEQTTHVPSPSGSISDCFIPCSLQGDAMTTASSCVLRRECSPRA
ncbi:Putative 2EXR domain-containing protein [Colletotrichum destructivum]|uniref:2EXR domain-containing protein n=1 Tax=Colletotrichum destructivum TaxID=34406 RepID=A0AAX4HYV0_9PEZI|nr:Putative 2EXR domain-containing protein [Colletotrichum destructivum]